MGREDALICATSLSPCCFGFSNRYGHWYYPNGTEVSNSNGNNNFFRNRGNGSDDGTVRLHRRNNALAPTGKFYCVIPDSSYNNTVTLYVTCKSQLILYYCYKRRIKSLKIHTACIYTITQ